MTKRPRRGGRPEDPTRVEAAPQDSWTPPAARPERAADEAPPAASTTELTIVGIGASAGGSAAFEAFFSAMPAHTEPGIAFVLVQHLAPDTGMGTVFVDHQLRIQRFTPAITQVIKLIQTDVGRPVGDIASHLVGYDSLVTDLQAVLDTLTPREVEVQTRAGAWFLLRIRPYRTLENVIEGAVITLTDISEVKAAQMALQESEGLRRLAVVVRDSDAAILVQALDGRILAWNPSAVRMYGWTEAEALSMNIAGLIPENQRETSIAKVREIARAGASEPYRAQRLTKNGRTTEVWLTAASLVDEAGNPYAIATTERTVDGGTP